MDVPFDPQDRLVDPEVVDELRVRRLGPRADRADPELERLRGALVDSAARIAELEEALSAARSRLSERVQEAAGLAAHRALAEQLETELAREREARRHAEDLLAGERDRFARVLAASQLELREALDRAREEGRAALDAARVEGMALREQLAAAATELDRAAAESRAGAVERAALEQELRAAQGALAGRPDVDALRAELAARAAAEERAIAELTSGRPGADRPPPARSLAPDVPPADHPALGNVADRAAVPDSVIADLARAAERLRELAARETEEEAPAAEAPAAGDTGPPAAALAASPVDAAGALPAPQEPVPAESEPGPLQPLLPPLADRPTAIPWLAPALAELAREDLAAATRLLLDLLPVQGLFARRPLSYELAVEHGGVHRVHVARGSASVERDVTPGGDVPVRIAGSVAVLAPLVAGGRARPHGARVGGRRRRLRRLLRDLRTPVGLPELERAGVLPAPADLLALLAASVRPDRTRGTSAVVSYVVGGAPRAAVVVADGAPLVVLDGPDEIRATAEVHATPEALLAVLAGTGEAQARGDLQAVERLHRWLRLAQGLDA